METAHKMVAVAVDETPTKMTAATTAATAADAMPSRPPSSAAVYSSHATVVV